LLGDGEEVPSEMIEVLLRKKRILVIIDGLSEMSEKFRGKIDPDMGDFHANTIIATSRLKEDLKTNEAANKTTISPMRIAFYDLERFINTYLHESRESPSFSNLEVAKSRIDLNEIVGVDNTSVPVLLAILFVNSLVARRIGHETDCPKNIPELFESYLRQLNRRSQQSSTPLKDGMEGELAAKVAAWTCVEKNLHPAPIGLSELNKALSDAMLDKLGPDFLNKQLRILEPAGEGMWKFVLDPLAEYLAALYLLDSYRGDWQKWDRFLSYAEGRLAEGRSSTFLESLHKCTLVKAETYDLPRNLSASIGKLIAGSRAVNEIS
jgi:hypothetical protein